MTAVGGIPEAVASLSPDLVIGTRRCGSLATALTDALLGGIALPDDERCIRHARSRFDLRVVAARVAAVFREAIEHAK